jgi:hypothetical protein
MALNIEPRTQWPATAAAYLGGVLGAVAVIVHEVHTGISGRCPEVDPFTHVLAELTIFASGCAVTFGLAANVRNWLSQKKHSLLLPENNLDELQAQAIPAYKAAP